MSKRNQKPSPGGSPPRKKSRSRSVSGHKTRSGKSRGRKATRGRTTSRKGNSLVPKLPKSPPSTPKSPSGGNQAEAVTKPVTKELLAALDQQQEWEEKRTGVKSLPATNQDTEPKRDCKPEDIPEFVKELLGKDTPELLSWVKKQGVKLFVGRDVPSNQLFCETFPDLFPAIDLQSIRAYTVMHHPYFYLAEKGLRVDNDNGMEVLPWALIRPSYILFWNTLLSYLRNVSSKKENEISGISMQKAIKNLKVIGLSNTGKTTLMWLTVNILPILFDPVTKGGIAIEFNNQGRSETEDVFCGYLLIEKPGTPQCKMIWVSREEVQLRVHDFVQDWVFFCDGKNIQTRASQTSESYTVYFASCRGATTKAQKQSPTDPWEFVIPPWSLKEVVAFWTFVQSINCQKHNHETSALRPYQYTLKQVENTFRLWGGAIGKIFPSSRNKLSLEFNGNDTFQTNTIQEIEKYEKKHKGTALLQDPFAVITEGDVPDSLFPPFVAGWDVLVGGTEPFHSGWEQAQIDKGVDVRAEIKAGNLEPKYDRRTKELSTSHPGIHQEPVFSTEMSEAEADDPRIKTDGRCYEQKTERKVVSEGVAELCQKQAVFLQLNEKYRHSHLSSKEYEEMILNKLESNPTMLLHRTAPQVGDLRICERERVFYLPLHKRVRLAHTFPCMFKDKKLPRNLPMNCVIQPAEGNPSFDAVVIMQHEGPKKDPLELMNNNSPVTKEHREGYEFYWLQITKSRKHKMRLNDLWKQLVQFENWWRQSDPGVVSTLSPMRMLHHVVYFIPNPALRFQEENLHFTDLMTPLDGWQHYHFGIVPPALDADELRESKLIPNIKPKDERGNEVLKIREELGKVCREITDIGSGSQMTNRCKAELYKRKNALEQKTHDAAKQANCLANLAYRDMAPFLSENQKNFFRNIKVWRAFLEDRPTFVNQGIDTGFIPSRYDIVLDTETPSSSLAVVEWSDYDAQFLNYAVMRRDKLEKLTPSDLNYVDDTRYGAAECQEKYLGNVSHFCIEKGEREFIQTVFKGLLRVYKDIYVNNEAEVPLKLGNQCAIVERFIQQLNPLSEDDPIRPETIKLRDEFRNHDFKVVQARMSNIFEQHTVHNCILFNQNALQGQGYRLDQTHLKVPTAGSVRSKIKDLATQYSWACQGVFSDSKENGPLQIVNGKVNKAGVSPAVFSDNQLLRILTPLQRRTYVSARLLAKFNLTLTMPAVEEVGFVPNEGFIAALMSFCQTEFPKYFSLLAFRRRLAVMALDLFADMKTLVTASSEVVLLEALYNMSCAGETVSELLLPIIASLLQKGLLIFELKKNRSGTLTLGNYHCFSAKGKKVDIPDLKAVASFSGMRIFKLTGVPDLWFPLNQSLVQK